MRAYQRFVVLAFACVLPALAVADPVHVEITSRGQVFSDELVFRDFGWDREPVLNVDTPYQLTLSADLDVRADGGSSSWEFVDAELTLQLGEATLHLQERPLQIAAIGNGLASSNLSLEYSFDVPRSSYSLWLDFWIAGPEGSLDGWPLAARTLTTGPEWQGYLEVLAFPDNPDAPGMWSRFAEVDSQTFTITAVPEPAPLSLALSGAALLVCWRRRIRM